MMKVSRRTIHLPMLTYIISHVCHGFTFSHPNPQGFFLFFHHFYHWFHDVALFPRRTLYWINIWDIMLYFLPSYYIITEWYIYIYISATPSNNTYKGLIMDVLLSHIFFHYYIITEGSKSATPSNNTYKGLIMDISWCYMFFRHITSLQKDLNLPPLKEYV